MESEPDAIWARVARFFSMKHRYPPAKVAQKSPNNHLLIYAN